MTLREVLRAHIPTLTAQSSVRDAVDKMSLYQYPALVVLDEMRSPIAVVTEGDLCRAVSQRDNLTSMALEPAVVYGTKSPELAAATSDIGEVFHRMLSSGLTILPVVDDGTLAGVVFRADLMQALFMDVSTAND